MFAVNLLEESGSGSMSLWVPVIVLGWFLLVTIVGWQVSRRNTTAASNLPSTDSAHSGDNASEFDSH